MVNGGRVEASISTRPTFSPTLHRAKPGLLPKSTWASKPSKSLASQVSLRAPYQTFFHLRPRQQRKPRWDRPSINIAPVGDGSTVQTAQIMKSDLLDIKEELKKHLANLIVRKLDPVAEQISVLTSTLKDVATATNAAHEESEKNGRLLKALQSSERQLWERIVWLEQRARSLNLKLRGFPESTEFNKNLLQNVLAWISPLMRLEDDVSPVITSAYIVGPPSSIRPNFPRDIIIQFINAAERETVLQMARGPNSLTYSGSKILVLLDLPQDVCLNGGI